MQRSGRERKQRVVELLGNRCNRCHKKFSLPVYDIHHTNPKVKKFEVNTRTVNTKSWREIRQEIRKCKLLCANCHRVEHAEGN